MGLKLLFIHPPHTLPPTDGEDKHFIVFCVKCLLVPAAQQWGIKKADVSHVFFKLLLFF